MNQKKKVDMIHIRPGSEKIKRLKNPLAMLIKKKTQEITIYYMENMWYNFKLGV